MWYLLSIIFLTVASAKAETSEKILFHKIGFPLIKLVSEVITDSSRGKKCNYKEFLHSSDDEATQLVM